MRDNYTQQEVPTKKVKQTVCVCMQLLIALFVPLIAPCFGCSVYFLFDLSTLYPQLCVH